MLQKEINSVSLDIKSLKRLTKIIISFKNINNFTNNKQKLYSSYKLSKMIHEMAINLKNDKSY